MSKGVFKYPTAPDRYDSSYHEEVIDPHKFFTSDLAQRKKHFLVGAMAIPEQSLGPIEEIIGEFLRRI